MKRLALAILFVFVAGAQAQEADEEGLSAEIGGVSADLGEGKDVTLHFIDMTDGVDVEVQTVQFDRGPYAIEAHYKDKPDSDFVVVTVQLETDQGITEESMNAAVTAFDPLIYRTGEFFVEPPTDAAP